MKREFKVAVSKEGEEYVARCDEVAGAVARGRSAIEAVERLKAVIAEILRPDKGPDEGSAPVPKPVSPRGGAPGVAKEQPREEGEGGQYLRAEL
jgi:predicted RNase H-like HicB family nuclease